MSERVYNDRVLMKMRADAGDSPLNFDFSNTEGQTDDLMDFQKFINKTSKDIKQLRFDTKYNEYTFEFGEDQRKGIQSEGTNVECSNEEDTQDEKDTGRKGQRKVVFSEHVTKSDTGAIDNKSLVRPKQSERRKENGGLDPSDIDLSFDSEFPDSEIPDKKKDSRGENPFDAKKGELRKRGSKNSWKGLSSPDLLSILQRTSHDDEYSSDFTSENDSEAQITGDEEIPGLSESGDELLSSPSAEKFKHRNKHCKHILKQKTEEYYNKLPKLLRTAELKAKLPLKTQSQLEKIGKKANHGCMEHHKVAYDRALTLARFRSLPFSHSFLSRKISNMNSFSYFSGLPSGEEVLEKDGDDNNSKKKKKLSVTTQSGREAIFGDIDMDDFYSQDDELIYFINPEELKNGAGAESSRNEDQISSRSATTTFTSGADSENER